MGNLGRFGCQTLRINISDDIDSGRAGVMGDRGTRSLNVSIIADDGQVLEDNSVKTQMVVKTEDESLIISEGQYIENGLYNIPFPDKCFETEQDIRCIIRISKENEIIQSSVFTRRVDAGLVGTIRDGKSTMIDLLKVLEFGDSYEEKMRELETLFNEKNSLIINNATNKIGELNRQYESKLNEYNTNASSKINESDRIHETKINEYNNNALSKVNEFNSNNEAKINEYKTLSSNKLGEYNSNHEIKISEYNSNANTKENQIEEARKVVKSAEVNITNIESSISRNKQDFDSKYSAIVNIVQSEKERVEAENLRKMHDERLQKIFTDGLNAELGNYAKKSDLEKISQGIENLHKDGHILVNTSSIVMLMHHIANTVGYTPLLYDSFSATMNVGLNVDGTSITDIPISNEKNKDKAMEIMNSAIEKYPLVYLPNEIYSALQDSLAEYIKFNGWAVYSRARIDIPTYLFIWLNTANMKARDVASKLDNITDKDGRLIPEKYDFPNALAQNDDQVVQLLLNIMVKENIGYMKIKVK